MDEERHEVHAKAFVDTPQKNLECVSLAPKPL